LQGRRIAGHSNTLGSASGALALQPRAGVYFGMENAISQLAAALRERLAIIRDENSRRDPETHTARLRTVSETIERIEAALPGPIDPQLAHFLQRKSYDKALEYLEQGGTAF
jgi:hypothetical protein